MSMLEQLKSTESAHKTAIAGANIDPESHKAAMEDFATAQSAAMLAAQKQDKDKEAVRVAAAKAELARKRRMRFLDPVMAAMMDADDHAEQEERELQALEEAARLQELQDESAMVVDDSDRTGAHQHITADPTDVSKFRTFVNSSKPGAGDGTGNGDGGEEEEKEDAEAAGSTSPHLSIMTAARLIHKVQNKRRMQAQARKEKAAEGLRTKLRQNFHNTLASSPQRYGGSHVMMSASRFGGGSGASHGASIFGSGGFF
jgi:hypothetical protein